MAQIMKTIFKIVVIICAIILLVISYTMIKPKQNTYMSSFNQNNRILSPKNMDKFIVHHISDKNQEAIESDWGQFLGKKKISFKRKNLKIEISEEERVYEQQQEENESLTESPTDSEKTSQDEDDAEWEKYLNKHPAANKGQAVSKEKKKSMNVIEEEKVDYHRIKLNKKLDKVRKKKLRLKMKIILIYTGLHKKVYWTNLAKNETKSYLRRTKCPQTKCHITYDKQLISLADAVIFHERNMPSLDMLRSLSKIHNRPYSQRWVYFTSESPKNSETSPIPYNGFFNWTMTYKSNSDIFLPYLQYRKLEKTDKRPPIINYAKTKNASIAWLVGNCNFLFRMKFVTLLSRETKVHVGGGCRENYPDRLPCTRWCDLKTLQNYKFYLSFENGICTDYITEKYWKYLEHGLVPIVLGGANYSDPKLAIPNSFIDASKFKSVKELALYIDYLEKNDTAYNEYFAWKQKYKIWHPPVGDWPFESYIMCELCKKLFANEPPKVYRKLSDFWNIGTDCQMPEDELTERFIPKDFDKEQEDKEEIERMKHSKDNIPKDFDEDF